VSEDNLYDEPNEVLFRPSYSATFLHCEAALLDGRFYPDSSGIEAAIGTVFHDLMQEWLITGKEPAHRLGTIAEVWKQDADRIKDKPFLVEVDSEMFFYGQQCLDFAGRFRGERFVERRVDISHITPIPDQSGTLDLAFLRPRRAVIVDWKYGTGVKVFAEWNTQELLYLDGIFEEFDWKYNFQKMELWIAQPRLKHWDKFTITRKELLEWREWARARMKAAWKRKNRTYTPGIKQCTWCKRRDDCRAKLVHLERIADEDFDRFTQPISAKEAKEVEVFTPPRSMETTIQRLSTEELAKIFEFWPLFDKWFRKIGQVLLERGIDGEDLAEFYVAEGRSNRHWKNELEIVKKVKLLGVPEHELYNRKLISPNQMEKLLRDYGMRGKALEGYIALFTDRAPGKPTLVRKGEDERAAIDDYSDVFEASD
jgi:hypothetical protein